jgi:hypothetical protein
LEVCGCPCGSKTRERQCSSDEGGRPNPHTASRPRLVRVMAGRSVKSSPGHNHRRREMKVKFFTARTRQPSTAPLVPTPGGRLP